MILIYHECLTQSIVPINFRKTKQRSSHCGAKGTRMLQVSVYLQLLFGPIAHVPRFLFGEFRRLVDLDGTKALLLKSHLNSNHVKPCETSSILTQGQKMSEIIFHWNWGTHLLQVEGLVDFALPSFAKHVEQLESSICPALCREVKWTVKAIFRCYGRKIQSCGQFKVIGSHDTFASVVRHGCGIRVKSIVRCQFYTI